MRDLNIQLANHLNSHLASLSYMAFFLTMKINKDYIAGILAATHEVYEIENGRIEQDKDLTFTLIEKLTYIQIKFTCKISLSSKWNIDHTYHENIINIYEGDTVSGLICDIQSELAEIHSKTINYL